MRAVQPVGLFDPVTTRLRLPLRVLLPVLMGSFTLLVIGLSEMRYQAVGIGLLAVAMWLVLHWRFGAEVDRTPDQVASDQKKLRMHEPALVASNDGVVFVDIQSDDHAIMPVILAFKKIIGYGAGEVFDRNCYVLQREHRDQPGLDELRSAIDKLQPVSVTLRNVRKDGSAFWNELSIAPVRDEAGAIGQFVGVVRDVTELAEAQNAPRGGREPDARSSRCDGRSR